MTKPEVLRIPNHVAVIMDGNGRWAKARHLPRVSGYLEGLKRLQDTIEGCIELGVGWLTVFAFSADVWKRPESVTKPILKLIAEWPPAAQAGLVEANVRVRTIGRLDDFPAEGRGPLDELVAATAHCTGLNLVLTVNYSGRREILDACRQAVEAGQAPVKEEEFGRLLYDSEIPDPDLLIRTGGEQALFNCLVWQVAYAEFYFTDTLWPDFSRNEFMTAIGEYSRRLRRYDRI